MAWRKGQADQIGNLLQRWIRKNGMEDQVQRYTLQARWEEVVGPRLAARTRPDNLYRGRLKVRVANSAWLNELTFMRDEIITRITAVFGRKVVRELNLVVGELRPPAPPASRQVRRPSPPSAARERVEIPTQALEAVEEEVAGVEDPDLRQAVKEAWLAELERDS